MIWMIFNAAVSVFDMYIIASFYYQRLRKRVPVSLIVLAAVCGALCLYLVIWLNSSAVWNIVTSVAICIAMTFLFEASWKQRLFYPMIITSLGIISEIAVGLLFSGIYLMPAGEIAANPYSTEYLIGNMTSELIFFIFVRILCRLHTRNDGTLPLRHWLLIMLVPATSVAVCVGLGISSESYIVQKPLAPFLILTGVMAINTASFLAYDEFSAQSKALLENERAKNRMETDMRQYEAVITQSKEFAALLHDTHHHREAVYHLLAAGDSSAALSYLESLMDIQPAVFDSTVIRNNPAVDMILRRKITEAEKNGITVTRYIEADTSLPVPDMCLCLLFGNALDNAIDACNRLPKGIERFIEISVCYKNDRLTIRIANSSDPVKIVNNSCVTTKKNGTLHGYGLPNLQKIVADNGGHSVIRYEDGVFVLSAIFLL